MLLRLEMTKFEGPMLNTGDQERSGTAKALEECFEKLEAVSLEVVQGILVVGPDRLQKGMQTGSNEALSLLWSRGSLCWSSSKVEISLPYPGL